MPCNPRNHPKSTTLSKYVLPESTTPITDQARNPSEDKSFTIQNNQYILMATRTKPASHTKKQTHSPFPPLFPPPKKPANPLPPPLPPFVLKYTRTYASSKYLTNLTRLKTTTEKNNPSHHPRILTDPNKKQTSSTLPS